MFAGPLAGYYTAECLNCGWRIQTLGVDGALASQREHIEECRPPTVPLSRQKRREAARRQARIERKLC